MTEQTTKPFEMPDVFTELAGTALPVDTNDAHEDQGAADSKSGRRSAKTQRKAAKEARATDGDAVEKKPLFTVVGKKLRPEDVGETLEDLASMLESGDSEENAVAELAKHYAKTNVGAAYGRAVTKMRDQGATIVEAIVSETDVFPQVARELIAAGTTPRNLHANLRHAALIIVEGADIKAQIRSSMFKPILTLVIVIVFILVAAEFLLPGVADMFASIGGETPEITLMMVAVGKSLKWVMLVVGALIASWALFWVVAGRKIKKLRLIRDRWALRLPLVGPIQQMATAARFTEVLAACLASGMNELDGLEVAGRACGNEAVTAHVDEHLIRQRVGEAVFEDVADTPLFPWNLKNRIEVAPSPRQRIEIMRDLGKIFHKKSHRRLEAFASQVGPLSEIVVVVTAGVVILLVALPVTTFAPQLMQMSGH